MKKLLVCCFASFLVLSNLSAQTTKEEEDEEEKGGFKKENLFVGGTVGVGFFDNTFSFLIGPYFGYSINKYVDVAAALNYNYISQRDDFSTLKLRQSIIGPSAFVRLYPVKFLFAHAQYEYNFIKLKQIYGNGIPDQVYKIDVPSVLIGPGFASGRDADNKTFYYISVLFDVLKRENSPYTDNLGRINPIFRAGFNVALFQGNADRGATRQNRRRDY